MDSSREQPLGDELLRPEYWWSEIEDANQYWKIETSSNFSERRFLPPTPLLLASENPEHPHDGLVGFSYEVQVLNDEGQITPFAFNFFLPTDKASTFIEVATTNPELIEQIFQTQYAGLRLNRVPANKLVQLLNIDDLFPQGEPEVKKLGKLNNFYKENLRVHPVKLGDVLPANRANIEGYFAKIHENLVTADLQRKRES